MLHATPYPSDAVPTGIRAILDTANAPKAPRVGPKRFWTTVEMATLRRVYPTGGLEACLQALPGRSASAIYQLAGREGLRKLSANGAPRERHVWTTTPQIDAAITRAYSGKPTNGAIKRLALTLGRPRSWLSNRARTLGLVVPRFKQAPWSDAEIDIVRQCGGMHADTVRRKLRQAGYKRTSVAVVNMVKRLHIAREVDENVYSARGLGIALGVDSQVIGGWIAKGWLKAKRKPVEKGCDSERGDWQIHRNAIRAFVVENVSLVDFRKVDKFWLVDLLAQQSWEG